MKFLNDLDNFFNSQKDTEQKLTFLMSVLIMFFISYYFIYPYTDELYKESMTENKNLKRQINNKQLDIIKFKNGIIALKRRNKELKAEIEELSKTEIIMKNLINKVKFLIFNLNRWADIYNNIPKYVNNSNLLLLQLDNNLYLKDKSKKNHELVKLKMQITLKVMGNFLNVIKLINTFESKKELIKIVAFKTDGIVTSITIDIYGAEL